MVTVEASVLPVVVPPASPLTPPPVFHAAVSQTGMLVVWTGLAALAVIIAVAIAARTRDVLPVAACIGALVCTLNEPIYDILAKLSYAQSSHNAYTAFGRHIPWTVVVGYLPWVGLVPYLISRLMAGRASRTTLHLIALGLSASVISIEIVNAAWLHAWRYYGQSSWRGVLGGGVVQMAAMPLLAGLLFYVLGEHASQWTRALLGVIIPAVSLPMVFAATTFPLYVSNYANVSDAVRWVAACIAVGLCVLAVPVISRLAVGWQVPREPSAPPASPVAVEPPVLVRSGAEQLTMTGGR